VVCDLDNTLWSGAIGEGAVDHFHHAQRTLTELRRRGVLLAVNSKNDPRNVNWTGAALGPDDFVSMEINWDPKVVNMRRIQGALNLKFKDFVFIDDRPDERAQVKDMFPEIHVLDATADRTWKQLACWANALAANPDTDRTQQYREREERERFIAAVEPEDQTAAWTKLEIKTEVRFAAPAELKRVTELINRTNQFNLAGTRTSLKEVRRWHDSPGKRAVVVEAADKFGPMGLIAALLVDLTGPELRIAAFVLSCRVFGYGIENAVLRAIKRLAATAPEIKAIRGEYRETPHNEPCRKVYPDNGFCRDGDSWVLREIEVTEPPGWLTVIDRLSFEAVGADG
jgi:FkbH-like protein